MPEDLQLKNRITSVWFIILLGLMYHVVLHLTPLFYGINITKAAIAMPLSKVLAFGLSFCIPVFAIINVQYVKRKTAGIFNIVFGLLAMIVNTGHLSEIIITKAKQAEQLFVLIPLFLVSILLLFDSVKWFKKQS